MKVTSYTSYPEMTLSDHKPVAATLSITFPSLSTAIPKLQLDKGSKCKIVVCLEGMGKVNPVKNCHWIGVYKKDWVNKVKYKSFVYVQKRNKPRGKFLYKATFGSGCSPKSGDVVQAVYFMSQDYSKPCGFIEFMCP